MSETFGLSISNIAPAKSFTFQRHLIHLAAMTEMITGFSSQEGIFSISHRIQEMVGGLRLLIQAIPNMASFREAVGRKAGTALQVIVEARCKLEEILRTLSEGTSQSQAIRANGMLNELGAFFFRATQTSDMTAEMVPAQTLWDDTHVQRVLDAAWEDCSRADREGDQVTQLCALQQLQLVRLYAKTVNPGLTGDR